MNLDELSPEEIATLKKVLEAQEKKNPGKEKESASPGSKTAKSKAVAASTPSSPMKRSFPNRFLIIGGALLGVIALAAIYVFGIEPRLAEARAQQLLEAEAAFSPIFVENSEFLPYEPAEEDILPGSNPNQLALGKNGEVTDPAYFEFRSDNANENSHLVELYIDFYSQQGRDFISFNQVTLRNLIGNGRIILRVHPAVQADGFSIYAPEALAQVSSTHPDKAWDFFVSVMRQSNEILSTVDPEAKPVTDPEIVDFIASISLAAGVPQGACTESPCNTVDADSLKFLSFFSWLYAASDNPALNVGYYPPIIYINGELINQETYRLANPDDVVSMFNTYAPRR